MPEYLRQSGWRLTVLVLLLATVYFFIYHGNYLADPLHFNDDVVQHYLWLYDTDWADDYYARTSGAIQPWGFYGLLWTLGHFLDPLPLSRYGPLLITWLTAWFTVGILRRYLPLVLALAGTYLVLQYTLLTGQGFLARSFSTPLLAMFAYFLLARRVKGVAATLVLSALFYPPVMLINGLILVLWEAGRWALQYRKQKWRSLLPEYVLFAAGGAVALIIAALQAYFVHQDPDLGDFFGAAEIARMAEFRADGRVPFSNLTNTPYWWMGRYFTQQYLGTWLTPDFGFFVAAAAGLLGLATYRKLGALSAYLLLFIVTTLALYEVARLTTPLLFLADRYLVYPWRFGVPLLITFSLGAVWVLFPRRWLAYVMAAVCCALSFFYYRPAQVPFLDMSVYAELYDYLAELPQNTMIAAPPEVANFIPLVSRRSVVLSHEAAHGLSFRNYYDYVTPRFRDYTAAITAPADSLDQLTTFLDKYAVDILVVDPDMLHSHHHHSFSPYDATFRARTQVQANREYAALRLADSLGLRVGNFVVIDRRDLR